jgi:quercetin dioxygenase-like cupin family protein
MMSRQETTMTHEKHHGKGRAQPKIATLPPAKAVSLVDLVDYAADAVVSKTVANSSAGTMTLFAFAAGQGLSEHAAPFDAYVAVLDGVAELTIGGQKVIAKPGEMVFMPANVPHAVKASQSFKMLLTMLRG